MAFQKNQGQPIMQNILMPIILCTVFGTSTTVFGANNHVNAAIGLTSSQITESQLNNNEFSFPPLFESIVPLEKNFAAFNSPVPSNDLAWEKQLQLDIKVEHKIRDLSYVGRLIHVDHQYFTLLLNNNPTTLPKSDFYLIPMFAPNKGATNGTLTGPVTYQTHELHWQPKLTIIVENNQVRLLEQVLITNQSVNKITIKEPILHLSQSQPDVFHPQEKRLSLMQADAQAVQYAANEITIPFTNKVLTLTPLSRVLVSINQQNLPIKDHFNQANVNTSVYSNETVTLLFDAVYQAQLKNDSIPGMYSSFIKTGDTYLPTKVLNLDKLRKQQTIEFSPNVSQEIQGELTLVSSSARSFPATQVWQLTLRNLSNQRQSYRVHHAMNGVITAYSGAEASKTMSGSKIFIGQLTPNQTLTLNYQVTLIQ